MEPLAIDVKEAARLSSLSVFTIRRYIKRGLLKATRVGRRVIVPVSSVELLVRQGCAPLSKENSESVGNG